MAQEGEKNALGLSGETYEDQRLFRKSLRHRATAYDLNYHSYHGMIGPQMINDYFKNFGSGKFW